MARKATGLLKRVLREGPSVVSIRASSVDHQYHAWLQQEDTLHTNGYGPAGSRGYDEPGMVISVVMLVEEWNGRWFADSLMSIAGQRYRNWELIVVCPSTTAGKVHEALSRSDTAKNHDGSLHIAECNGPFAEQVRCGVSTAFGEFIWMLRLGDRLHPEALHAVTREYRTAHHTDILYCDDDRMNRSGTRTAPFFKPSWSPELLLSMNYISYAMAFRRTVARDLLTEIVSTTDASQYDFVLWLTETTDRIVRIPRVLYHAMDPDSPSHDRPPALDQAAASDKSAVERALSRRGIPGRVEPLISGGVGVRYQLTRRPLISVIIPTKDRIHLLARCLDSLSRLTSYAHYEICILDNGSESEECVDFLKRVAEKWTVIPYPGPFNFSAMNNLGASIAKGEYLVFLNDDTEVMTAEWLTIMLEQAMQPKIGAVGAKLLFPDGSIQHGGIVLGIRGEAGHAFRHCHDTQSGYHNFPHVRRNCSAVSAACMMVSKHVFQSLGGFDEHLPVEFNDVDLCLRIRRDGYRIVYAPEAVLYHYENGTRRGRRVQADVQRFCSEWADLLAQGDPYYHPHLTSSREDWSLNI